ncbi:hypothetical protein [Glaciimonas immobilis]|uniref:Uncharacterized protein n=1 Tax=Glaciimonas immobilis TaxID=728004 RepID=A0A840RU99_9BURK|nr:hypothetical protein [Glaciimonas immobilis]KAF3999624.1 hypothetical protein HAV38_02005 [Glaciimonas immobilis]MBB5200476.1 hypothetical protein [Glaciimonas immobilis]
MNDNKQQHGIEDKFADSNVDNNTADEDNPMGHPEEQPTGTDGTPKFGRLLIVLILMVIVIGFITFASEWFYS